MDAPTSIVVAAPARFASGLPLIASERREFAAAMAEVYGRTAKGRGHCLDEDVTRKSVLRRRLQCARSGREPPDRNEAFVCFCRGLFVTHASCKDYESQG